MMFRGLYEYTIDPKGRVNVPAPFRDLVQKAGQESLIITKFQECLHVFPLEEWSRIEEKLAAVPATDLQLAPFVRSYGGSATEVFFDKQGRILVPPSLRNFAGLEKDVAIIGMQRRFEIWSRERCEDSWARFEKELATNPELSKRIGELGI